MYLSTFLIIKILILTLEARQNALNSVTARKKNNL